MSAARRTYGAEQTAPAATTAALPTEAFVVKQVAGGCAPAQETTKGEPFRCATSTTSAAAASTAAATTAACTPAPHPQQQPQQPHVIVTLDSPSLRTAGPKLKHLRDVYGVRLRGAQLCGLELGTAAVFVSITPAERAQLLRRADLRDLVIR